MASSSSLSASTDALREQVLQAARHFKTSWVELGQFLFSIYKDKLFKSWGYITFETYCNKELSLKLTTASKLIKSYEFLEREEPRFADVSKIEETKPEQLPHYDSVNLLRLAKQSEKFTPEDLGELQESVLKKAREPQAVRAQMKRIMDEKLASEGPQAMREQRRLTLLKRLSSSLDSARRELASDNLAPAHLLKQIDELRDKLMHQISG